MVSREPFRWITLGLNGVFLAIGFATYVELEGLNAFRDADIGGIAFLVLTVAAPASAIVQVWRDRSRARSRHPSE